MCSVGACLVNNVGLLATTLCGLVVTVALSLCEWPALKNVLFLLCQPGSLLPSCDVG